MKYVCLISAKQEKKPVNWPYKKEYYVLHKFKQNGQVEIIFVRKLIL